MSGIVVRAWAWAAARIDAVLSRVTSYRLITLVLSALVVISLVLGSIGTLSASPVELALSLAVVVGVAYLSNMIWALLWRVPARGESAVITGLLLFFLMWPSSTPKDLGWSAVAAGVATLSKYLLRWRGRHIFNPVAVGAVAISLAGAAGAAWWVATPTMLLPVAVGGFLVVRRTGKAHLVATFLIIVLALTTLRLLDSGTGLGDSIAMALESYPWVFLAAFMLTEPRTLPARRWQRLVFAAVVAVVAAVPLSGHVGSVSIRTSPELALIVGNIIVMLMGTRGVGALEVITQRKIGAGMHEVTLRSEHHPTFVPGQYLDIDVPHRRADTRGTRRSFSITSGPHGDLAVAFRVPDRASSYKKALVALNPGDRVQGSVIAGDFLLPKDPTTPLLFIAGGVGITPFIAHFRGITASQIPRNVVLIYAVSSLADVIYADVLMDSRVRVVIVSPESWNELPFDPPANWTHHQVREIPDVLLGELVEQQPNRAAYVSGPPAMVDSVRGQLRLSGFRAIHTDSFFGY